MPVLNDIKPVGAVRRVRSLGGWLLVMAFALVVGIAFAALGEATSPLVIVALPIGAFWLTVVLARPVWGPAAFFLAMPFALQRVSAGSFQVIDLVAIVAVGAVVLARTVRPSEGRLPFPWILTWGVALCVLATLSLTSALDRTLATDQLIVLLASFLLACAVVAVCERMEDVRILVAVFLVVGCVMSVAAFTTTTSVTNFGTVVQTRSVGFFQDPNELGSLAAMLLIVALGVTLSGLPRWYRLLGGAAAVLATSALALSLSRGAWLGTFGGLLALTILIPRAWRILAAVAAVGLVLGLTLGAFNADPTTVQVLSSRFGQLLHPIGDPYDQRPEIWREAEREIAARPWLGYGPNNFAVASARSGSEALTVGAVHAHDVLLTVGAEIGLPAVGALIAFTLALAWAAWRTRRALRGSRDAAMVAGLAAALFAFLVHGIVDYTLRSEVLLGLLWVLAALVVACDRITRGQPASVTE
jgi:O-antigen ligase